MYVRMDGCMHVVQCCVMLCNVVYCCVMWCNVA